MSLLTSATQKELESVRNASDSEIQALATQNLPTERLPHDFLNTLSLSEKIFCLRISLICWIASSKSQVPREMQLRVMIAECLDGKDVLVSAGTGSGKTLPVALGALYQSPTKNNITLVISPLKRLQSTQASDFESRYGLKSVVINEESSRNPPEWWRNNIFGNKKNYAGTAEVIIVTVEQLFRTPQGHWPKVAKELRENPAFQKRVNRVIVDEAHCIGRDGESLYGEAAFRPNWKALGHLKRFLPLRIRWLGFSATLPPHILRTVTADLMGPGFAFIQMTSNRPNTMYATHKVIKNLDYMDNYNCFIMEPFCLSEQWHVIIFIDDTDLTRKIASHLDLRLPAEYRGKGKVVRHYNSEMSEAYLQETHEAFTNPDGACRILVSTSGQSVGIDFPNVRVVCNVGIPSCIIDALQRGGRAVRTSNDPALFVVFYEAWVEKIDLAEFTYGDPTDPDRPRSALSSTSKRPDRVPRSGIDLIQQTGCLRKFYADYLGDTCAGALDWTTPHCCDRHNDGFILSDHLQGPLCTSIETPDPNGNTALGKRKYKRNRPPAQRKELEERIINLVHEEYENHPLKFVYRKHHILSDTKRHLLVLSPRLSLDSGSAVAALIGEDHEWESEWGEKFYNLIHTFDTEVSRQTAKKAKR